MLSKKFRKTREPSLCLSWEKMLSDTEAAVASGNKNTVGTNAGGGRQYSIETNAKGKYVKADRQVIFGMDPKSWGEQVENYIHKQIMNGETIEIPTDDGDTLVLTENTVGKSSFRNFLRNENRYMNDEEYLTKLNAETHIDELAQISKRGDKVIPDFDGIHGEMAKDGWNYRTAYFEDFDGKYYRLKISTALGEDGKTVYNIGDIERRSPQYIHGSSGANTGAQGTSSDISISETAPNVNRQNVLKTEDLLSPEYRRGDSSAEPQNDTGDGAYSEEKQLEKYYNDAEKRAQAKIGQKKLPKRFGSLREFFVR